MTTQPRTSSPGRRLRRIGGQLIRRWGLMPSGMPDGVGDDDALVAAGPVPEHVLAYFGGTVDGLYQLEQWLPTLQELHLAHPVLIVTADSRAAHALRSRTHLRVVTVAHFATLDEMVTGGAARLALYVSHHTQNFALLRFGGLTHVSLLHGDSDKVVSVSNQAKAYDFTFVAGRAAIDRLAAHLRHFDADERCVVVGRPQAVASGGRLRHPDGLVTVLYAPTWEGAERSAGYGSVPTHGTALVRSLLADGSYRVVYRPHPLTGVRDAAYGDADAAVRALVTAAGDGHRVSTGRPLADDFAQADVLVADVSAVAVDWLATDRPLLLTQLPGHERPTIPLAVAAEALTVREAHAAPAVVAAEVLTDPHRAERHEMAAYYLGDRDAGAALQRFLTQCDAIVRTGSPVRGDAAVRPTATSAVDAG